jgi:hypothetical protein
MYNPSKDRPFSNFTDASGYDIEVLTLEQENIHSYSSRWKTLHHLCTSIVSYGKLSAEVPVPHIWPENEAIHRQSRSFLHEDLHIQFWVIDIKEFDLGHSDTYKFMVILTQVFHIQRISRKIRTLLSCIPVEIFWQPGPNTFKELTRNPPNEQYPPDSAKRRFYKHALNWHSSQKPHTARRRQEMPSVTPEHKTWF